VNRLALAATVKERGARRFTPAGLPALDLTLDHRSEVVHEGTPRKVSLQVRALAIGAIVEPLERLPLGAPARFHGFLAAARNGRGLLFHIDEVQAEPAPSSGSIESKEFHHAPAKR
jgi:primosomal replication protein N